MTACQDHSASNQRLLISIQHKITNHLSTRYTSETYLFNSIQHKITNHLSTRYTSETYLFAKSNTAIFLMTDQIIAASEE